MKTFIQHIIDDLKNGSAEDIIPEVPAAPVDGKTVHLDPPPAEPTPEDLDNQILSDNNAERVRQLDYQAQESEEFQSN
jgi:hypothetical protein